MLQADSKRNTGTLNNELLIPFAGLRNGADASVRGLGYYAYLWLSSNLYTPYPGSRRLYMGVLNDSLNISYNIRAHGHNVRCIYNSYDAYSQSSTLSFDSQ